MRMPKEYTKEIYAIGCGFELHLMVKPHADLDDRFGAWCLDENEPLMVNGWMFEIEDVEAV